MFRLGWLVIVLILWGVLKLASAAEPLLDYVNKSDPTSGKWDAGATSTLAGDVQLQDIHFVSQTWQGIKWEHHLSALKPPDMKEDSTALLFITGNYHPDQAAPFALIAAATHQPVFILWDVPNQPLYDHLTEDALISYTFEQYLKTGDATWPLLFPMTKAAIQAMDVAQAVAKEKWKTTVPTFVVSGASKRGWTTWMTAATGDKRVIGIAPMVYNNLNLGPQMKHQIESWGKYSEQIADYTDKGLQEMATTPSGQKLSRMVDPYTFRDKIRIPKLLINGTNDRYWTLDAASLYFNDLAGPKHLLYDPNSGHGLNDLERVTHTLGAFFVLRSQGKDLPQPSWEYQIKENTSTSGTGDDKATSSTASATLSVTPGAEAKAVRVWTASAPTRDLREAKWSSEPMKQDGDHYTASLDAPKNGYAALFGEVEYSGPGGISYTVSTQVQIIGKEAPKP